MTPTRAILRTGAVWFLPVVFVLACLFASRNTFRSGYPAGDLAQASVGLYVAAPMSAAFMALQYRGFTHFLRPLRQSRSGIRVTLRAWWPLLVGAPTSLCLAVAVTARTVPNDLPSWSLILIDFTTVLAAVLTGLACSWVLPTVVAVPLAAVVWFAWIGYGPASSSITLHNLGSTFGCCTSETRPAYVAIRATLLLLLVTALGIACLLASSRSARLPRPLVASALALVCVGGFSAGFVLLHAAGQPLSLAASEPRTTPLTCRTVQSLEVCLWPENRDRATSLATVVDQLNPQLQTRGMTTIRSLTQANRNSGAVSVEAGAGLSDQDLRLGIAVGYVDLQSGCPGAVGAARDQLVALVALLAGMDADEVASRLGARAATWANDVLDQGHDSPMSVGARFRAGLRAAQCGPQR